MSISELPDVVRDALGTATQAPIPQKARKAATTDKSEPKPEVVDSLLIEFPLASLDTSYPNSRVDVHLDEARARRFRCLLNGLMRARARLANDMPVRTNADVVRWILDQPDLIAAAVKS